MTLTEKQIFSITVGVNVVTDSDDDLAKGLRAQIINYLKSIGCNDITMFFLAHNHAVIDGHTV